MLELDITIYRHQCNLPDEINIKDCQGVMVEHSSPFMAYPATTMNYQPLYVVVDTHSEGTSFAQLNVDCRHYGSIPPTIYIALSNIACDHQ